MKSLFVSVILICTLSSFSVAPINDNNPTEVVESDVFKLYPTENMWTFIKLNTRTGQVWQVQYDINGEDRFESYVNSTSLVTPEEERNGKFELYPTQNMYNFILLDQISGKMWQVQWSLKHENRGIMTIY